MSQTPTTAAASSRFQAIFQAALKSYQKQAKKDILAHPLTSQLNSCESTGAIVVVLQDQVREFDKSRNGDERPSERLTKWLGPTVNVLYAFSAAVSGGVGLVCLHAELMQVTKHPLTHVFSGIFSCECNFFKHRRLRFSKYPVDFCTNPSYVVYLYRLHRVLPRVGIFSLSSLNASDTFLHGSKRIQRWHRLQQ
jgi:hypothetical protein